MPQYRKNTIGRKMANSKELNNIGCTHFIIPKKHNLILNRFLVRKILIK
jgi:hypothetical protein